MKEAIQIERFESRDQNDARALILRGLGQHWSRIDESLNPDLEDIGVRYAAGHFVVARSAEELIGTGAFLPISDTDVQIQRMSVAT
jgi:hypothetical protein